MRAAVLVGGSAEVKLWDAGWTEIGQHAGSAFVVTFANARACAIALTLALVIFIFVDAGGGELGQSFWPTDWRSTAD
jgi:hypothetical protein